MLTNRSSAFRSRPPQEGEGASGRAQASADQRHQASKEIDMRLIKRHPVDCASLLAVSLGLLLTGVGLADWPANPPVEVHLIGSACYADPNFVCFAPGCNDNTPQWVCTSTVWPYAQRDSPERPKGACNVYSGEG